MKFFILLFSFLFSHIAMSSCTNNVNSIRHEMSKRENWKIFVRWEDQKQSPPKLS